MEKVGQREHICFYFATGNPKRLFYWGLPNVPKTIGDGPINMAPFRKCEHTHEVINMNHNR